LSYKESEKLVTELLQSVSARNKRMGITGIPDGFQLPQNELINNYIIDSEDLVAHGEAGIALENLLENLYEVSFKVDNQILELSKNAVDSFGFEWSKWRCIEELLT